MCSPAPPSHPQLLLYIATASEEKHVYNIAGPAGPEKFEGGVQGYEARGFRGCGVVTSTPFEISDDADSLQMLQRNTQVGEFYRMRAPSIKWPEGKKEGHENYLVRRRRQTPRSRFFATRCSPPAPPQPQDIVIYNEDSDMHVHIPFEEALKASCIFDDKAADSTAGPWVKPGTNSYYTKKELIDGAADGTWMAVSLVIARPFIEHRMMSAIMAVAGSDTGATLFGPADMQISANTSVKTIEGCVFAPSRHTRCPAPRYVRLLTERSLPRQALHVRRFLRTILALAPPLPPPRSCNPFPNRCHTKSVITKPQNVMVLRDIMCNGYVAGCNTAFFGAKDPKAADKEYSKEQIQADINTRLTMADGDEVDYPSMLAFYEDYNEAAKRDQVISISNRVLPWDTTNGDTRDQFPGGKTGWGLSSGKGLEGIHYGEDLRATSNQGTPNAPSNAAASHGNSHTHTDSQTHPACVRLHRGVDGQQLGLLHRPAPRLLAVERDVPGKSCLRCFHIPMRHADCCIPIPAHRSSCLGKATSYATASNSPPVPQRRPRPTTHLPPSAFSQGPDALPGVRTQLSCTFCNSHSVLTVRLALTGCPLAPWRVGVARVGAQRDDGRGGGDALAAGLPAPRRVGVGRRRRRVKRQT